MILLLSSRNDKTTEYFYRYINKNNGSVINYYWDEFFVAPQNVFKEFLRDVQVATGVYVREPTDFDIDIQILIDGIYFCLSAHPNKIIPRGRSSNWSKFYHHKCLEKNIEELGLNLMLPETFIGTINYIDEFGEDSVYKPVSNMPGIAVRSNNMLRYPYETSYPTPFIVQKEIIGTEVRVHVIDDKLVSMQLLRSNETALDNPTMCSCKQVLLPDSIKSDLVTLTNVEGLRFAGIDLFIDCNNVFWLLEVNPMPGYHSFDEYSVNSGDPNSDLLYKKLVG
ncbi:hypothetical protein [Vibrio sp. OPT24]|uniref:hypothetical protein n=1 Tax=Vibrio sp. OPT24 TaxID=2778643 RepID=UPI0018807A29|nr:hypothetical protein [Vibrio sp. OPT24]MBE8557184.1 hypothetical protein [Vibrio sp. OPT24]